MKDHRREHVPVLGDRDRRHFQPRRLVDQLVDAASPVEKRILGMKVKVDEVGHDRDAWFLEPGASRRHHVTPTQ
jgi:hypothetical protein